MRRRRRSIEPACTRCGNEEDLQRWGDGNTYCTACLRCDCLEPDVLNHVCVTCLRRLHTLSLFDKIRIRDVNAYVRRAYEDYGLRPFELMYWSFEEEEEAITLWEMFKLPPLEELPRAPPPHLRTYGKLLP